jgi:hypothetical protein
MSISDRLIQLIALGLFDRETNWNSFLTKDLYDPRLLLLITNFVDLSQADKLQAIYPRGLICYFPDDLFIKTAQKYIRGDITAFYWSPLHTSSHCIDLSSPEMVDHIFSLVYNYCISGFKLLHEYSVYVIVSRKYHLLNLLLKYKRKQDVLSFDDIKFICQNLAEDIHQAGIVYLEYGVSIEAKIFLLFLQSPNFTFSDYHRWYQMIKKYFPGDQILDDINQRWNSSLTRFTSFNSFGGFQIEIFFEYFSKIHPLWEKILRYHFSLDLFIFLECPFSEHLIEHPDELEILLRANKIDKRECLQCLIEHDSELVDTLQDLFPKKIRKEFYT